MLLEREADFVRSGRHGTMREEVFQQLRERILLGYYAKGTALTELRVSQELGVSRTPIREAFSQLLFDGLVSATPNKSIIVEGFDQQDILDLYEVRSRIETLAAERAANQMTDDQRQALQAIYVREAADTEDPEARIHHLQSLDADFHDLIFQGSGSKILRNMLTSINQYTRNARIVSLSMPGRRKSVLQEHARILEAILRRDGVAAHEQMRAHISMAAASFQAVGRNRSTP